MTTLIEDTGEPDAESFAAEFNRRRALNDAAADLHFAEITGLGLYTWWAYVRLRHDGAPLPERLLAQLDKFAAALLRLDRLAAGVNPATGEPAKEMTREDWLRGVALAIGMEAKGRWSLRQQNTRLVRDFFRQRAFFDQHGGARKSDAAIRRDLVARPGMTRQEVDRAAAALKKAVARWIEESPQFGNGGSADEPGLDLVNVWRASPKTEGDTTA